jgi:hypothetical protein
MRYILVLSFLCTFLPPEMSTASPAGDPAQAQADSGDEIPDRTDVRSVPEASRQRARGKPQKIRKWTGNLVDAGCMANALRQLPSINQMLSPDPLPRDPVQAIRDAQPPPPGNAAGYTPPQGESHPPRQPGSPDFNGVAENGEHEIAVQKAELKRDEVMRQQVKVCSPKLPSAHLGLLVSGGRLLQFDSEGNFKVRKVVAITDIKRGAPVKVKVTGVIVEEADVMVVASIEIKGREQTAQNRPSQGILASGFLH